MHIWKFQNTCFFEFYAYWLSLPRVNSFVPDLEGSFRWLHWKIWGVSRPRSWCNLSQTWKLGLLFILQYSLWIPKMNNKPILSLASLTASGHGIHYIFQWHPLKKPSESGTNELTLGNYNQYAYNSKRHVLWNFYILFLLPAFVDIQK